MLVPFQCGIDNFNELYTTRLIDATYIDPDLVQIWLGSLIERQSYLHKSWFRFSH